MNKKQFWTIIILLIMIILWLLNISYKLDNIDWDVRQILGKITNLSPR